MILPVTNIISTQPSFDVTIDPTAQDPIADQEKTNNNENNSKLITMHVTYCSERTTV